jgi:hypothetical protein
MSMDHKLETDIVETLAPMCKYLAFETFKLFSHTMLCQLDAAIAPKTHFLDTISPPSSFPQRRSL